jgi:terminase small subunit-like protein
MTPKQRKFAAAIAAGKSGAAAAREAGCSARTARSYGSKLRKDPRIVAEVDRIRRGEALPLHEQGIALTPLEFLLSVMCSPTEDTRTRIRAAIAAAPYVNQRGGKKDAASRNASEVARGRFSPGAGPTVLPFRRPGGDSAA